MKIQYFFKQVHDQIYSWSPNVGSEVSHTLVWVPTLPPTSSMTLGKLFVFSEPQYPYL